MGFGNALEGMHESKKIGKQKHFMHCMYNEWCDRGDQGEAGWLHKARVVALYHRRAVPQQSEDDGIIADGGRNKRSAVALGNIREGLQEHE